MNYFKGKIAMNPDNPLELSKFLPPCRGKVRMGVEWWKGKAFTPSLALPLQGEGILELMENLK
jgi:hypothetical protein